MRLKTKNTVFCAQKSSNSWNNIDGHSAKLLPIHKSGGRFAGRQNKHRLTKGVARLGSRQTNTREQALGKVICDSDGDIVWASMQSQAWGYFLHA